MLFTVIRIHDYTVVYAAGVWPCLGYQPHAADGSLCHEHDLSRKFKGNIRF